MSRTRLEWAQWMAAKGIVVFVVEANSKRPLGGYSWYERQTTDPNQVAAWFKDHKDCNFGLHLGEQYVAIDLDVKPAHNGVEEFEKICAEHGIENFLLELPTLMSRTPGKGYHLFFKVPFPCANKNDFPAGIDVRGAVGYVVGPGSEDSRGSWEIVDPDMPIMDAPEWLLEYLYEPGQRDPNHQVPLVELDDVENIEQAMEWLKQAKPAIQGDEGDQLTYDTICMLRDFGISEGHVFELLNESGWNERCEPPWDASELTKKIENSYQYGQNRPGVKAITYEKAKLMACRPAGGWGAQITDAQVAELFHPPVLELVVDNTVEDDPDIPSDVTDDEAPLFEPEDQLWYDFNDFIEIENVREYIVKDWLIAHGVTALLAKRGTGKSTVALDLSCHLACDMDWLNLPSMRDWCVIYICGEDDEGMILNARAWTQYYDRKPARDRFLVARDIIKMTDTAKLKIRLKEMKEWAGDRRCVVILDTWARATSGSSSNTQEEMDVAYNNAEAVAKTLNGPMIACFHPPKDGRMTIRGSAVQEDASSGIWSLEKVAEGIRLNIQRAKGPGEGNWCLFSIENITLPGEDFYGEPLNGIVPVKFAGREDEGKVDYINKLIAERRAWAEAIVGCWQFPEEDNVFEKPLMNRKQIALMLTNMWMNREDDLDALDFTQRYMRTLDEMGKLVNVTRGSQVIYKKLSERFFGEKVDRTPIRFGNIELVIEQTAKGKSERFIIRAVEKDQDG